MSLSSWKNGALYVCCVLLITLGSISFDYSSSSKYSAHANVQEGNTYRQYFSENTQKRLDAIITSIKAKKTTLSEVRYNQTIEKLKERLDDIKIKYRTNSTILNLIGYLEYEINGIKKSDLEIFFCELEGKCSTTTNNTSTTTNNTSTTTNNTSTNSNSSTVPSKYVKYNGNGGFNIKIPGYKGCTMYYSTNSGVPLSYVNNSFRSTVNGGQSGKKSINGIFETSLALHYNHQNYNDLYLSIMCYTGTYKKNGKDMINYATGKFVFVPKQVKTFSRGYNTNFSNTAIPGISNYRVPTTPTTPTTPTVPNKYVKYNGNGGFNIKIPGYKGCTMYYSTNSGVPLSYVNNSFRSTVNGGQSGKKSVNGIFETSLALHYNHKNYDDLYLSIMCYTGTYKKNGKDMIDYSTGKFVFSPKQVKTFSRGYNTSFSNTAIPGISNYRVPTTTPTPTPTVPQEPKTYTLRGYHEIETQYRAGCYGAGYSDKWTHHGNPTCRSGYTMSNPIPVTTEQPRSGCAYVFRHDYTATCSK